jgi:N6-adenosine-specific RNA methylase IME4
VENKSIAVISEIERAIQNIPNINTIPDARRLLALAQGYVVSAHKLYKASEINTIGEANEDKGRTLEISKKAGELRLYAEARLGELIKAEQEAGRLATGKSVANKSTPNNDVRGLKDYGLTWQDSSRAQQLAEHKDIIAKVIVDSLDTPTRAAVEREIRVQNKSEKKQEEKNKIANTKPPEGLFQVIVIDPPWPYSSRQNDPTHQISSPYETMTIEDIKAIKIPAADDSVLWLWATNTFLHDAFHVLEAWGFTYRTTLTWAKDFVGLGDWLGGQTEHCLMSTIGEYKVSRHNESTLLVAPRGSHSEKPDSFYKMVEKLCPGKKIDMFSRKEREGWNGWGAESIK